MTHVARPTVFHRYLDFASWRAALYLSWLHVFTGCLLVWIVSNGVDATAAACPWVWVREAFAGTGVSWKGGAIQAAVHATYKVISYINQTTPSHPPFHSR